MNSNPRSRVFSSLWSAVWQFRGRTLLAVILLIVAKITGVIVPLVLKAIVDQFSHPEGMASPVGPASHALNMAQAIVVVPVFLLLGYALLRFAGTLFTELRDMIFSRVTQWVVALYAERAFSHLLQLNPRFHTQRNTGSLIRDIERGTGGVGFLLGAGLFTVVPTLVEFASVMVVMSLGYSFWFTGVILLTFLVYAGFTTAMTQKREVKQRRVNEVDSTAHGRMVDGLLNYEAIKTYAREDYERQRYASVLKQWVEHGVNNQRALSTLHIGQSAIIATGVAVVMLLAGEQTVRGLLTVGDLVLVNAYVIQICLPLNTLGFVFREARDALVNTERLLDLMDQRPDIEDKPGATPLVVRGGQVSFEHVDFSYEAGRPILQDVSFTIGPGQTVAVVGGSGSGKSTLARLLLRLYDVAGGRITIDGQDVRAVKMDSLREAIGVVPQDTALFNDTIAYNIGYGRTTAGMPDIIEAAKGAQVHEFILSLPKQYETPVGERGTKLSGGEKQRIAIARSFLKNPPIMIFDEATSALDTRAERAIQTELDRIAQGRSTLIIAHRLSTIVNADHIIVMDKGRIVERGRHLDLLNANGLYAQLWNLQLQQQQFEQLERRLARQPINLGVLLAGVLDGLRETIDARGIKLYTEIGIEDARISGDPSTLAQLLRDLCTMALESTPAGGRIELRLERHLADARLTVTDGRHLGGEAGAASARTAESTLPLDPLTIRSTVERHGGEFSIEPPSTTHGMRFIVELPLHAIAATPTSVPVLDGPIASVLLPAPEGPPLQGMRIMSIDDLPDAREALDMLLTAEGAQVTSFSSGLAALDWMAQHAGSEWPQVILCDIALGEEDGRDVIHRIRQMEAHRGVPLSQRVPAVALSGFAGAGHRMQSMMAGFQAHLVKPVEPSELIYTLMRVAGEGSPDQAVTTTAGL
ncbi:MAG: ATP-binding cassette domain-containing protein [Acidobacteriota bacterium]